MLHTLGGKTMFKINNILNTSTLNSKGLMVNIHLYGPSISQALSLNDLSSVNLSSNNFARYPVLLSASLFLNR